MQKSSGSITLAILLTLLYKLSCLQILLLLITLSYITTKKKIESLKL